MHRTKAMLTAIFVVACTFFGIAATNVTLAQGSGDIAIVPALHHQLSEKDLLTLPRLPFYLQFRPASDGMLMAYTVEVAKVTGGSGSAEGFSRPAHTLQKRIELRLINVVHTRTNPSCSSYPPFSP